ncbi:allophanate hydrolase [Flavobacterium sp. 7A]|uniref:allophanate hydrolase n=1 Tax=Flavobacterium sp. 7A TaxID=2940571 RepID=UPI0022278730|nr:allophanate hydrolase [Flavobacterium sp. 7A]MCW2119325.1 allophanate hydrolase [Flavobacterium sp. 7A]
MQKKNNLEIQVLLNGYITGNLLPEDVISTIFEKIENYQSYNIWITVLTKESVLSQLEEAKTKLNNGKKLPLYGIPFVVKDNIDVANLPTTAACEAFTYMPTKNAVVVQQLLDAGAILIGKTNMDQFATGLVGTRSPYGAVKNAYNPAYISGGSSSGSAVAVALGMAAFSLGTDTAGSGRIPAGLNNLVGLKPSYGSINTEGLVPACKSLDCISIFANTIDDAHLVFDEVNSLPTSKIVQKGSPLKIAIPNTDSRHFEEKTGYEPLFTNVTDCIAEHFKVTPVSMSTFTETAKLLYHGPWIAERMAAIEDFYIENSASIHPVVREIIQKADNYSAVATFKAIYKLEDLKVASNTLFDSIDFMIVPTAPGIYKIDEVENNPITLNSTLGHYTNFVNLLGLCALAIPVGFTPEGIPFGITLITKNGKDKALGQWAKQIQKALEIPPTANKGYIDLAVAGLHKRNQPLVFQLTELNAHYSYTTTTSPNYKMYLVDPNGKQKPGLIRVSKDSKGDKIEVEIWKIPVENLGKFLVQIPHPLGLGKIEILSGEWIQSFICEEYITAFSDDISAFYCWENFIKSQKLL